MTKRLSAVLRLDFGTLGGSDVYLPLGQAVRYAIQHSLRFLLREIDSSSKYTFFSVADFSPYNKYKAIMSNLEIEFEFQVHLYGGSFPPDPAARARISPRIPSGVAGSQGPAREKGGVMSEKRQRRCRRLDWAEQGGDRARAGQESAMTWNLRRSPPSVAEEVRHNGAVAEEPGKGDRVFGDARGELPAPDSVAVGL